MKKSLGTSKKASRMFGFVDSTKNPIGGDCPYNCRYCWARALVDKFGMLAYVGPPTLRKSILMPTKKRECIFVSDMRDMFHPHVPDSMIHAVINWITANRQSRFLLLTKNPERYLDFKWPMNAILGATIEGIMWGKSTRYQILSKAPNQYRRLISMRQVREKFRRHKLFISMEPVLDFSLKKFGQELKALNLWGFACGFDNYNHSLTEPSPDKLLQLADMLEQNGVHIFFKTMREPHKK